MTEFSGWVFDLDGEPIKTGKVDTLVTNLSRILGWPGLVSMVWQVREDFLERLDVDVLTWGRDPRCEELAREEAPQTQLQRARRKDAQGRQPGHWVALVCGWCGIDLVLSRSTAVGN